MVTDCQVRKLMKLLNEEQTLSLAAAKSGMDEKTARKYRCLGKLPSEVSKKHSWRTREDSFAEIWEEVRSKLDVNSGLQAKTLFKDLQRRHPGQYQDGQLRTLQRRVKQWHLRRRQPYRERGTGPVDPHERPPELPSQRDPCDRHRHVNPSCSRQHPRPLGQPRAVNNYVLSSRLPRRHFLLHVAGASQ